MVDHYQAVLADLRAKREQIDQAIALLSGMRTGAVSEQPGRPSDSPQEGGANLDGGPFFGMSIVDAAKKLLAVKKSPMPNAEIYKQLADGGLVFNGADPVNVVSSVLTRRFNQVGDIVRVSRGVWGLADWFPNRDLKFSNKNSTAFEDWSDEVKVGPYELRINDLGGSPTDEDDDL